jgi:hypothetical protein
MPAKVLQIDKMGVLMLSGIQSILTKMLRKKRTVPKIDVIEKWRGQGKLPVGKDALDYLKIIRDGEKDSL